MKHSMQSMNLPALPIEVCEAVLATALALLPRPLSRHDTPQRTALSTILNVVHPRLTASQVLDAALHTVWWFTIETATVGGTCLRLDLLGRAIRFRGMCPESGDSRALPIRTHPSHFNLEHGSTTEDTIALLEWWFSPDSPTTWVPTFHGLVQAGLANDERRETSNVAVDKWKHAVDILEWWLTTGRLNVRDEEEMKRAQWMVIDFGNVKTIDLWRKVYEVEVANFSANERKSFVATVACVLTVGDVGAVQYCQDRQLECVVHKRAVWDACMSGNVEALDWFISLRPAESLDGDGVDRGIKMAAQVGHITVLDWMQQHGYLDLANKDQAADTFNIAAEYAQINVLDWLWLQTQAPATVFRLKASVAHDILSVDALDRLRDRACFQNLDTSDRSHHHCNGFTNAAAEQKLDVMEWWVYHAPDSVRLTLDSDKAHCLETILHRSQNSSSFEAAFKWCMDHGFWLAFLNNHRHGHPYLPLIDCFVHSSSVLMLNLFSQPLEQAPGGFSEVVGHVAVQSCASVEALQWWIDSGYTLSLAPHILVSASVPVLELARSHGLVHVAYPYLTGYAWQAVESAVFNSELDLVAWWMRHLTTIGIALTKPKLESYLQTATRNLDLCMVHWLTCHFALLLHESNGHAPLVAQDHGPWEQAWRCKK